MKKHMIGWILAQGKEKSKANGGLMPYKMNIKAYVMEAVVYEPKRVTLEVIE